MRERDNNFQTPYEIPLSLREYATVRQTVTRVNETIQKRYPEIESLNPSQIIFVEDIVNTTEHIYKKGSHPFYLSRSNDNLKLGKDDELAYPHETERKLYFDKKMLIQLNQDPDGFMIYRGLDFINASFLFSANTVFLDSDAARRTAEDITQDSYSHSKTGSDNTLDALEYIKQHGSNLKIHGTKITVMVENKTFTPTIGQEADSMVRAHLSLPLRLNYVREIANELNTTPDLSSAIEQYLSASWDVARPQRTSVDSELERNIIDDFNKSGYATRDAILYAYLNGDYAKSVIEGY